MTESNRIESAMYEIFDMVDKLETLIRDFHNFENVLSWHESQDDLKEVISERKKSAENQVKAFKQSIYVLNKYKD